MEEKRFSAHQNFLQTIGLPDQPSELEISVTKWETISEETLPELNLYRNEFYEISLVNGLFSTEFAIDGKLYQPQGEPFICFVAPEQLQSYRATQVDLGVEGHLIYISKQAYRTIRSQLGSSPFFQRENESYYPLSEATFEALSFWTRQMALESENPSLQTNSLLINLTNILLLKAAGSLEIQQSAYFSRPEQIVDHFLNTLANNSKHLNVQHYADELALTPKQLNAVLKKVLNKSASLVIQESTVEKAKGLILQSSLTFTEIAYQLGFEELSNFSRLFKRITSYSPRQFKLAGQN